MHLGGYEEARALARDLLAQGRQFGRPLVIGEALQQLGYLALLDRAYGGARQHLEEGIALYRALRMPRPLVLVGLAHAAHGQGLRDDAVRYLVEALRTADWMGAFRPRLHALAASAVILADRGERERAVELYALASRYPFVANSRLFEDIAGKHVATAAEGLPPEVVAAAQDRGRARDL
jgi:hypothetical protein